MIHEDNDNDNDNDSDSDKDKGKDKVKTVTYRLKFIDSYRIMQGSLSSLLIIYLRLIIKILKYHMIH